MQTSVYKTTVVAVAILGMACVPSAEQEAGDAIREEPVGKPIVTLQTNIGVIRMELEPELAPETVQNFLAHVRAHFYDSLTFHRVRPGFMIQAGRVFADRRERISQARVANEADNGLLNVRGAVAMARTFDAHSASTEFFINLVPNPTLDFKDQTSSGFGYAVFGHVVEGMEVVDSIAKTPTRRVGSFEALPLEPVIIYRAFVEDR